MLKFLPFPPKLAEISRASASNHARTGMKPRDHETPGVAAFRMPDGTLRIAHDILAPQYPKGATPGIATAHLRLKHYPNDTSGYQITADGFRPASEILRDNPIDDDLAHAGPWDQVSISFVSHQGRNAFVMAIDEDQMQAWIDTLPDQAHTLHPLVHRIGMEHGERPTDIFMASAAGGTDLYLAGSKADLGAALSARYSFLDHQRDDDPDAIISSVIAHGKRCGWVVEHQEIRPSPIGLHKSGCDCPNCIVKGANLAAAAIWGGAPRETLVRKPTPIWMAMVQSRAGSAIVHAATREDLAPHIARAGLSLCGLGREDMQGLSDAGIIEWLGASDPEFRIWEGEGLAHTAHGAQPVHFAMVLDGASHPRIAPDVLAVAASGRNSLERALLDLLRDRMSGLGDLAEFDDLEALIHATPGMAMSIASRDDLEHLLKSRPALTARDATEPEM